MKTNVQHFQHDLFLGLLPLMKSSCIELRDVIFAKVRAEVILRIGVKELKNHLQNIQIRKFSPVKIKIVETSIMYS